jgi:hypothetical protein
MAGAWSWQLAAVIGALVGSVLTLVALGGRWRSSSRRLEESRTAILRDLREIEGLLDPGKEESGARPSAASAPPPEPIRMVQVTEEPPQREAA